MKPIYIGTRGSRLAVAQAEIAAAALRERFPNAVFEIIRIETTGDRILSKTIDKIGGKGVFVKEIETALLDGKIDLAVHSMKDLPEELAPGLCIGAALPRESPWDVLASASGGTLASLPAGAKIGTGSLRRQMQLAALRPDLVIEPIRGNINTRLEKLADGFDGIVLAEAGLLRAGLPERISQVFSLSEMAPAACQGILALEIREGDAGMAEMLAAVNDPETALCARAERGFLQAVGAGCHAPIGAYARREGSRLLIDGFYTGKRKQMDCEIGSQPAGKRQMEQAEACGRSLGRVMLLEKE